MYVGLLVIAEHAFWCEGEWDEQLWHAEKSFTTSSQKSTLLSHFTWESTNTPDPVSKEYRDWFHSVVVQNLLVSRSHLVHIFQFPIGHPPASGWC